MRAKVKLIDLFLIKSECIRICWDYMPINISNVFSGIMYCYLCILCVVATFSWFIRYVRACVFMRACVCMRACMSVYACVCVWVYVCKFYVKIELLYIYMCLCFLVLPDFFMSLYKLWVSTLLNESLWPWMFVIHHLKKKKI